MTPTGRSLNLLRAAGYTACVVERWVPHVNIRKDCFGWADLLAAHPIRHEVVLLQVTTRSNLSSRIKKAKALPALGPWLQAGGLAWFHGWFLRAGRWQCRAVEVTGADLVTVELTPRLVRRPAG